MDRIGRGLAAAAVAVAEFAAVAIGVATAANGPYGYISEAGAPGAPQRDLYRVGVIAIAMALGLLATALAMRATVPPDRGPDLARREAGRLAPGRNTAPGSPSRWAVVRRRVVQPTAVVFALAAAAPFAVTSAAVPCSPGCPLPPYESPTQSDIMHALASIGGLGLAAVAMLLLAAGASSTVGPAPAAGAAGTAGQDARASRDRSRLRSASLVSAGLLVPLLAATGLAMLVTGRGLLAGLLERAALVVALGWLGTAAAILTITRAPDGAATRSRPVDIRRRT